MESLRGVDESRYSEELFTIDLVDGIFNSQIGKLNSGMK